MADAEAAMALALADGRALLTIENRDLGTAVVEHVVGGLAGRLHPARETDARTACAGGAAALRAANLLVDGKRLALLAEGTSPCPPALTRIRLAFEKGRLDRQRAASRAAGRDADFKARVRLGAGAGRRLRINVEDIRVQGAPPLPLSAITAAVLTRVRQPHAGREARRRRMRSSSTCCGPRSTSCWWRRAGACPTARTLRLSSAVVSAPGTGAGWAERDAACAAPQAAVTERTSQGYEPPRRGAAALGGRGAPRTRARGQRRTSWRRRASARNDEEGAVAALQVCIENARPGPLVGTAWRRLVELYARRGDPHAAARALIASADDTRTGASEAERAAALVAAAEILRKRLALPGDAGMLLERAIALDPTSIEALEALEALTTETERLRAPRRRAGAQAAGRGARPASSSRSCLGRLVQHLQRPGPAPRARPACCASGWR